LRPDGWSTDSGFASHAASLAKDSVVALLRPYAPNGSGAIEIRGECRDVTILAHGETSNGSAKELQDWLPLRAACIGRWLGARRRLDELPS
jgi:hypothetical protein